MSDHGAYEKYVNDYNKAYLDGLTKKTNNVPACYICGNIDLPEFSYFNPPVCMRCYEQIYMEAL